MGGVLGCWKKVVDHFWVFVDDGDESWEKVAVADVPLFDVFYIQQFDIFEIGMGVFLFVYFGVLEEFVIAEFWRYVNQSDGFIVGRVDDVEENWFFWEMGFCNL